MNNTSQQTQPNAQISPGRSNQLRSTSGAAHLTVYPGVDKVNVSVAAEYSIRGCSNVSPGDAASRISSSREGTEASLAGSLLILRAEPKSVIKAWLLELTKILSYWGRTISPRIRNERVKFLPI